MVAQWHSGRDDGGNLTQGAEARRCRVEPPLTHADDVVATRSLGPRFPSQRAEQIRPDQTVRSPGVGRDLDRDQRLDEIIACYLDDVARGQAPERGALFARHPDLAADLKAFFTDQDRFNRLATPLREIAPGSPHGATSNSGSQGQTPALSDTQSFATKPTSGAGDTPALSGPIEGEGKGEASADSAATVADGPFDPAAPHPASASLPTIAGYEMLEEIGRGGIIL